MSSGQGGEEERLWPGTYFATGPVVSRPARHGANPFPLPGNSDEPHFQHSAAR